MVIRLSWGPGRMTADVLHLQGTAEPAGYGGLPLSGFISRGSE